MKSFTLGLVADDLTGANDAAVQFARRGWEALLVLETVETGSGGQTGSGGVFDRASRKPLPTPVSVLALTTDSRALDNAAAEKLTANAVEQLIGAGVDRIYLKIDSTMRGSVPGQIAGALKAWRRKHPGAVAVVCPAYPRMRRTVTDNRLLVDGEPVEHSPIGRDPVAPVKTSDLAELIPGSTRVSLGSVAQNPGSILTVDVRGDEDLTDLAAAIEAIGASAIPVGSAGLADAMAAKWGEEVRPHFSPMLTAAPLGILIQVTSLNPVSRAQVERLAEAFPEVVVLSGRAEEVSADFVDRLQTRHWDLLGLIGGDGARATLHRLGASAIRVVTDLLEGVPLGFIAGGRADGMPVFTKAGGFGAEDALVRIVEMVKT